MNNNVLVVVSHPDDEVLGIGGTILKHIKDGDKLSILILGDGEQSRDFNVDVEKRKEQAKKASELLGVTDLFLEKLPDNQFDSLPLLKIVKIVENYLSEVKPKIIYTHNPHDLNIDHQITFNAVLTACRPIPSFFVKKILAFECPSSTEWQIKDKTHNFCPTVYSNITEFIDKKIEILRTYEDELKEYPHSRSEKGIKILAQYRGMEVGCEYAEAFQLIRNLND